MGLLRLNYFRHTKSKLAINKYVERSLNFITKSYSTTTVASDKITNDNKPAEFLEPRLNLWDKLKTEYDDRLQNKTNEAIKVQLPYGQVYDGVSWQTTPNQIYKEINKKLAKDAIVASVNNELWDLNRPLEKDCQVDLLTFENPLAKEVLWHSSAHVLGSALENIYGSLLNTGPATQNGFYYDVYNFGKNVSVFNRRMKILSIWIFPSE